MDKRIDTSKLLKTTLTEAEAAVGKLGKTVLKKADGV